LWQSFADGFFDLFPHGDAFLGESGFTVSSVAGSGLLEAYGFWGQEHDSQQEQGPELYEFQGYFHHEFLHPAPSGGHDGVCSESITGTTAMVWIS
jgi:hypothetical protein